MIKIDTANVFFDVEVGGENLTDDFKKRNSVDILGYRCVRTAGIALPTFELIISSTNDEWLKKFNEQNTIKITVGSDMEHLGTYEAETVGHNIKEDNQHSLFLLYWGGVLSKNKLNSTLLKDVVDEVIEDTAYGAIKTVWEKRTGNQFISDFTHSKDMKYKHDVQKRTLQNFLVDLQLRMDERESFPMCTIGYDGNLYCRSFRDIKAKGPTATFVPSAPRMKKNYAGKAYYYIGDANTISFKTYANRHTSYKQISAVDMRTGNLSTAAMSMANYAEGWGINSLAITSSDERNPIEHRSMEVYNLPVDSKVLPIDIYEVIMFNKEQLINMSSIQSMCRFEGPYLDQLNILDLVDLKTMLKEDRKSGLYIIEAIEQGFMFGGQFINNVWMCRDNYNDVDRTRVNPYNKTAINMLNISPKSRAQISSMCRNCRDGLILTKGFMNGTYKNRIIQHLIQMRAASLTNFDLFSQRLDFQNMNNLISSLRKSGQNLIVSMIDQYVPSPFDQTLKSFTFGNASAINLLLSLLAGIVGGEVYTAFYSVIATLREFDYFLDNYQKTVKHVSAKIVTNYSEPASPRGTVSFVENADGTLEYITEVNRTMNTSIPDEVKTQMVADIVDEIQTHIPDDVDIPIPEIVISDSDAIKPKEELKEDIVDYITTNLIDKGYVYDDTKITFEMSETERGQIEVVQANGQIIDGLKAQDEMISASTMKSALIGNIPFGTNMAYKIKKATGLDIKTRFWGLFDTPEQLTSTYVTDHGYVDKYRSVACTKVISARGGKRIYVALPSIETHCKFYINSQRVDMIEDENKIEYENLGYMDKMGKPIPYTIYYTSDYYNSATVTLEIRKGT